MSLVSLTEINHKDTFLENLNAISEIPSTTAMQDQKVNNETVNQEQSLTLVRNLIRVTISQIAYMRNIFPSKCFEECKSI